MAVRDGAKVPVVPSFKISRSAVNCLNLGENVHSCHRDWCKGAVVVMFHVSFSAAEQVVLPRLLHNCSSDGSCSEDLRALASWEELWDREGALQGRSAPPLTVLCSSFLPPVFQG